MIEPRSPGQNRELLMGSGYCPSAIAIICLAKDGNPLDWRGERREGLRDQRLAEPLLLLWPEGGVARDVNNRLARDDAVRAHGLGERVEGGDVGDRDPGGLELLSHRGTAARAGPSGRGE